MTPTRPATPAEQSTPIPTATHAALRPPRVPTDLLLEAHCAALAALDRFMAEPTAVATHRVLVFFQGEFVESGRGTEPECLALQAEARRHGDDARIASIVPEPIHARSAVFVGFSGGDSCWSGRRTYQERKLPNGQVELVCGRGLDDAHFASGGLHPFAMLKSKKSREASFVTCPECIRRIRAAGFVHAPKVSP